ncbi:MAG: HAD-IA family hydrolase [Planctomycetota bacterium]|nr:HAD-IA family hydrolase [Planctomycetota bacterium]MDA1105730.1 HAD-IA family hydrolase [Planctomycetota bacterium]
MPIELVAFDLDGTLIDSLPGLTAAVNEMRASLGHAPARSTSVEGWIGRGTRHLVASAVQDAVRRHPSAEEVDAAHDRFVEAYTTHSETGSTPRAGAMELLSSLSSSGMPCAITTNKLERFSWRIADRLGFSPFLRCIIGGDTGERKPSPWMLQEAARRCGADPARGLLVGDSRIDVETAAAAGWPIWVVAGGYGAPGPGEPLPPGSARFADLAEVRTTLLAGAGGRGE